MKDAAGEGVDGGPKKLRSNIRIQRRYKKNYTVPAGTGAKRSQRIDNEARRLIVPIALVLEEAERGLTVAAISHRLVPLAHYRPDKATVRRALTLMKNAVYYTRHPISEHRIYFSRKE